MCRIIGKGRTGTVYLAFHKELEEFRAIKAVEKSSVGYETFRKEALLLKELRHPGIPVVYDIEDDENYSYLVEEYLQGDSLETLVNTRGPLARCTVLEYAIQICGVVNYLHSAGTEPILHLDLQPKNLLVCHEVIKLVDFGQSARLTQANQAGRRFGTVGFAAPEQYDCGRILDERTDIYAIGGLLFYLATGMYPDRNIPPAALGLKLWGREEGRILAACLEPVRKERYQSVSQLKEDLEHLQKAPASSLTVAVLGLEPCVGTTHISLALTAYLRGRGILALYEEAHPSGHIHRLMESRKCPIDASGIFRVFGCEIKPFYGKQVKFLEHRYPVVVQDKGVWNDEGGPGISADICLFVAGGKWWNREPEKILEKGPFAEGKGILLYNFSDPKIPVRPPAGRKKQAVLRVPLFSNPFAPDGTAKEWLRVLWSIAESNTDGGRKGEEGGFLKKWRIQRF